MQRLFNWVDGLLAAMAPVTDFLWAFPRNFEWYNSIPIIRKFFFCHCTFAWNGNLFYIKDKGCAVSLF